MKIEEERERERFALRASSGHRKTIFSRTAGRSHYAVSANVGLIVFLATMPPNLRIP